MRDRSKCVRENYKPDNAIVVTAQTLEISLAHEIKAEVYFFEDVIGRACARGFKGRVQRPSFSFIFESEERRLSYVTEWLEGIRIRSQAPHSLKVGDVLCSSWGYDQTNVDFYQITKRAGKTMIEFVRVGVVSDHPEGLENSAMQDYVMPNLDVLLPGTMRRRVSMFSNRPCISINSSANAYLWDGTRKFRSWYA